MIMNLIAWDPIDKKMGVVETYQPKTGKVMFENDSWDWYKRDRIVRRPTGLQDKNDNPIYEGDIVSGGRLICTEGYSIKNDRTTVSYESGMFKAGSISLCSINRSCEVIGNIYEEESANA